MRHWALLAAFFAVGAMALLLLAACTTGRMGTGGEGDAGADQIASDATDANDANDANKDGNDAAFDASDDADGAAEASCSGVTCNGQCLASGDCTSCAGAPLLCAATRQCAADCTACTDPNGAAMPTQCFACDSNHQNPIGTCQYDDAGSYCLSGDYRGAYHGAGGYRCACAAASDCPGATQACVALGQYDAGFCLTCGEITVGTEDGQPCKGGGTCHASQSACQ
jgi:hypothetical protein